MSRCLVRFVSEIGDEKYSYVSEGIVEEVGNELRLKYTEISDEGSTLTEISVVGGDFVTVKRTGKYSSYLEFRKNYLFEDLYRTDYGFLTLKNFTEKITLLRKENFIKLKIFYNQSLSGNKTENKIEITVRIF